MTADGKADSNTCEWHKVQTAALRDDPAGDEEIKLSVLEAQRLSVKLPVVRKVAKPVTVKDAMGKERPLHNDQVVICDVVSRLISVWMFLLSIKLRIKYTVANRLIPLVPRLPPQRRLQQPQRLPNLRLQPERRPCEFQRQRDRRPRPHSHDQSPRPDEESPSRPRHAGQAQKDRHRSDL